MRYLLPLFVLIAVGCGQPSDGQAKTDAPIMDPNSKPPISQTATRTPADPAELKALVDLEEYPGAEVVESVKLSSDSMSPDEARYDLSRKSKDAPAKVAKFYEENLGDKSTSKEGHLEVFGRTKSGNYVRVHIDPDGTGSKFSLNVISYSKK